MNQTATTQAQADGAPQRRIDDLPLPAHQLQWNEEGTPLAGTSVVYLYRPRDERFARWADILTQEHLLEVKAAPERFELRTLFTVPVDELARSPITLVAAAQTKLDIIKAATSAVIANMRAVAREIGGQS